MLNSITPYLLFEGKAQEAMNFYTTVFENCHIERIEKYTAEGPEIEGTIKQAIFSLNGRQILCADSCLNQGFTFPPAFSLLVNCSSEREMQKRFETLSDGGSVLMSIDDYGISQKFAWLQDRYGVSWQLNLPYKKNSPDGSYVCFANSREVRPEYRD